MTTIPVETLLERIIQNDKLSHTYMFEGDSIETLKRYAEYFAVLILGDTPHNRELVNARNHPDYQYVRTDDATIKKEQIDVLVRQMYHKPIASNYKVYVIEAFEKLTIQAENSILKFLEEPPNNTIALLLTIDKSQILPTIHSRSQHIYIKGEASDRESRLSNLSDGHRQVVQALGLNSMHVEQLGDGFPELLIQAKKFTRHWLEQDPHALIDLVSLLQLTSERFEYHLLLQIIDGIVRQCLHQTMSLHVFKPFNDIDINDINPSMNAKQLTRMLDEVTRANQLITSNVNPMLVFESMVISSKG